MGVNSSKPIGFCLERDLDTLIKSREVIRKEAEAVYSETGKQIVHKTKLERYFVPHGTTEVYACVYLEKDHTVWAGLKKQNEGYSYTEKKDGRRIFIPIDLDPSKKSQLLAISIYDKDENKINSLEQRIWQDRNYSDAS